jgi:hypothetical protein
MPQLTLFDVPLPVPKVARQRKGWVRLQGGVGGVWVLTGSGLAVQRCGHPTANWPYHGTARDGRLILSENGRGFRTLLEAQLHVELLALTQRYPHDHRLESTGKFPQDFALTPCFSHAKD